MNYRIIDHKQAPLARKYLGYLYDLGNPSSIESIYCCLPKGTVCITVSLQGIYYVENNAIWHPQPSATVFGLITQRQFLMMSPQYREITIGFHPHHFQQFLRESMSSLSGQVTTDLTLLFDKYLVEKLIVSLTVSKNDTDILNAVELFLSAQLHAEKKDTRLHAAHEILTSSMLETVGTLSEKLDISPTRLRELFRDKIGFSPKEALRIARIKKALERKIATEETLTQLAYELHYFDQSHFIHDFQSIVGLTPKQYFKNPKLTGDFYNYSRLQFSSFA